ncbi:MAG: hypothetical protein E7360_03230 [Clostridiales bacterium]|nr:hypothetical protein [Clostridiales bacterium]
MYGKAKRVLLNLSFILAIFCICLFFLLIVLIPQFEDLYFSTIDELVLGLPVFLGCFLFFLAYDSEYSYEPTFLRIFALVLGWILVIPFGLLTLLFGLNNLTEGTICISFLPFAIICFLVYRKHRDGDMGVGCVFLPHILFIILSALSIALSFGAYLFLPQIKEAFKDFKSSLKETFSIILEPLIVIVFLLGPILLYKIADLKSRSYDRKSYHSKEKSSEPFFKNWKLASSIKSKLKNDTNITWTDVEVDDNKVRVTGTHTSTIRSDNDLVGKQAGEWEKSSYASNADKIIRDLGLISDINIQKKYIIKDEEGDKVRRRELEEEQRMKKR